MSHPNSPHVTSKYLSNFQGKTVRVIGKVGQKQGTSVLLYTTDNGQIWVDRSKNLQKDYTSPIVEILGTYQNNSLTEIEFLDLSENFDFELYNQMVDLSYQLKDIFF
ncbi:replication protein a3 [Anaeramoeba flamelloides]|uniref:Replication protein a3 n=1 Tax=Anaeramoeba flamelloides TaxID=1746091 RepID=A0AAV8AI01_9EUKA|nr:replication protein a3 [Anaeramoeba flamelloides]